MVYLFVFYCLIFCPFHIRSLDRGDDTPIYTRDLDRDPVESRLRGKISDVGNYQRISFRLRFMGVKTKCTKEEQRQKDR